ncbi:hypothetical protein EX30DRAFT_371844 [Ascodesmis nigricans]|uniref:Uncharacterized protein n=1 Tax=Ascodesmis nigricans TaxID=341454 RepID=A0A4S2MW06_9PEZI|nr:hypothetical protein EX30DRAFT_371844 [Ascodesmis nigricans]
MLSELSDAKSRCFPIKEKWLKFAQYVCLPKNESKTSLHLYRQVSVIRVVRNSRASNSEAPSKPLGPGGLRPTLPAAITIILMNNAPVRPAFKRPGARIFWVKVVVDLAQWSFSIRDAASATTDSAGLVVAVHPWTLSMSTTSRKWENTCSFDKSLASVPRVQMLRETNEASAAKTCYSSYGL